MNFPLVRSFGRDFLSHFAHRDGPEPTQGFGELLAEEFPDGPAPRVCVPHQLVHVEAERHRVVAVLRAWAWEGERSGRIKGRLWFQSIQGHAVL